MIVRVISEVEYHYNPNATMDCEIYVNVKGDKFLSKEEFKNHIGEIINSSKDDSRKIHLTSLITLVECVEEKDWPRLEGGFEVANRVVTSGGRDVSIYFEIIEITEAKV